MSTVAPRPNPLVEETPGAQWLLASTGTAPVIWLIVRVYLGFEWLMAGWGKITGGGWLDGGAALQGFAGSALERGTEGENPAIAYGGYVWFLEMIRDSWHPWMAPMVAIGQVAIGTALILGAFVGIAAFLGVVMNFSFVFAGTAGVNPLFLILGLLLMLAWRNAGWYGLDRFLLPKIGVPWSRKPQSTPA